MIPDSKYGFDGSGGYQGTEEQKGKLLRSWERKVEFMKCVRVVSIPLPSLVQLTAASLARPPCRKTGTPQWNGEFGPVYASPDDDNWEQTNTERYNLLKDQLAIYKQAGASWTIWLLKDCGFQGMVYAGEDSAYRKALKPFMDKKKRLAADVRSPLRLPISRPLALTRSFSSSALLQEWGTNTSQVQHLFDPFEEMLEKEVPHIHERYPKTWSTSTHVGRLLRNILLSEELCACLPFRQRLSHRTGSAC